MLLLSHALALKIHWIKCFNVNIGHDLIKSNILSNWITQTTVNTLYFSHEQKFQAEGCFREAEVLCCCWGGQEIRGWWDVTHTQQSKGLPSREEWWYLHSSMPWLILSRHDAISLQNSSFKTFLTLEITSVVRKNEIQRKEKKRTLPLCFHFSHWTQDSMCKEQLSNNHTFCPEKKNR